MAETVSRNERLSLLGHPRAMLGLLGVYVASRCLGLFREVGVAFYFGTSADADRFAASFVVAGLAGVFLGEATYAAAVRWLGEAQESGGSEAYARAYAQVHRLGRRVAAVVCLGFAVLGPVATLMVLGRFDESALRTCLLSLALVPAVTSSVLISCVNARLTLEKRFVLITSAQMLFSVGALGGLVAIGVAGEDIGPLPVAVGWSVGNVAALVILYRMAPPRIPGARGPAASGLVALGLPVATAYSLVALEGLTDQSVAARLGTGNAAALAYANRLFLIPIGFVLATVGPIVLGALTAFADGAPRNWRWPRTISLGPRFDGLHREPRLRGDSSGARVNCVPLRRLHRRLVDLTRDAIDGFAIGVPAVSLSGALRTMQAIAPLKLVFVPWPPFAERLTQRRARCLIGLYGVTVATSLRRSRPCGCSSACWAASLGTLG